jgi:PIN domain nuclease of toxin-antitoxin system
MNLLLDTHALIWWLFDDSRLVEPARSAIAEPKNRVLVSAASAWEISTKHRLGKLPEAGDLVEGLPTYLRRARFGELPVELGHALAAGALPGPHRDPFDRMLIAQARIERLPIVTIDPVFRDYGVRVVWSDDIT